METINIPKPKYTIGDLVYHIIPESDKMIVIDAKYSVLSRKWVYTVSLKAGDECDVFEFELSPNKQY